MMHLGDPMPDLSTAPPEESVRLHDIAFGDWSVFIFMPRCDAPVARSELLELGRIKRALHKRRVRTLMLVPGGPDRANEWLFGVGRRDGIWWSDPVLSDFGDALRCAFGVGPAARDIKTLMVFAPSLALRLRLDLPYSVGLSSIEILRLLDAMMLVEHGEAETPANWMPGMPLLDRAPRPVEGMDGTRGASL